MGFIFCNCHVSTESVFFQLLLATSLLQQIRAHVRCWYPDIEADAKRSFLCSILWLLVTHPLKRKSLNVQPLLFDVIVSSMVSFLQSCPLFLLQNCSTNFFIHFCSEQIFHPSFACCSPVSAGTHRSRLHLHPVGLRLEFHQKQEGSDPTKSGSSF